jgi:hypothetical protein
MKTFKKYFPTLDSAVPYERKPQKIANEFGFQLNEEFIHGFVRDMSKALEQHDITDAIKVDTSKPNTLIKQTFKKPKQVA